MWRREGVFVCARLVCSGLVIGENPCTAATLLRPSWQPRSSPPYFSSSLDQQWPSRGGMSLVGWRPPPITTIKSIVRLIRTGVLLSSTLGRLLDLATASRRRK